MNTLPTALAAARLLGRWTLVAERHGAGCSCCPGLGDVPMATVERSVVEFLKPKHPVLQERDSVTGLLRECIQRKAVVDEDGVAALFADLDRAIDDLERMQLGL
jgi:hypothetical protein